MTGQDRTPPRLAGRQLFDRVVEQCGLTPVLGPGIVKRALADLGVPSEDAATPSDYLAALPRLESRLALYVPPDELERMVRSIEGLLAYAQGDLDSEDAEDWATYGNVVEALRDSRPSSPEREALKRTGKRLRSDVDPPSVDDAGNGD